MSSYEDDEFAVGKWIEEQARLLEIEELEILFNEPVITIAEVNVEPKDGGLV